MVDNRGLGAVQKSSSSKAAAIFARRAYFQYVSTEKWRERRWRLFSTVPIWERIQEEARNKSKAYQPDLIESLRDANEAEEYLNAALEEGDSEIVPAGVKKYGRSYI